MDVDKSKQKEAPKPYGYIFGRPTKYKSEYCDLTKYLVSCKQKKRLPTIVGYACFLSISEPTIYEWRDRYPDFSRSLRILISIEKQSLINKALIGEYNSNIAKMMLSSNHGMSEKQEVVTSRPVGEKIEIDQIRQDLAELKEIQNNVDGIPTN